MEQMVMMVIIRHFQQSLQQEVEQEQQETLLLPQILEVQVEELVAVQEVQLEVQVTHHL
tara:strand:+ start:152 stop:328 length:177 start_codon:yes stop_codon:yes gene_type:complete